MKSRPKSQQGIISKSLIFLGNFRSNDDSVEDFLFPEEGLAWLIFLAPEDSARFSFLRVKGSAKILFLPAEDPA